MLLLKSKNGVGSGSVIVEFDIKGCVGSFYFRNRACKCYNFVSILFVGRRVVFNEFLDKCCGIYCIISFNVLCIAIFVGCIIPVNAGTQDNEDQATNK